MLLPLSTSRVSGSCQPLSLIHIYWGGIGLFRFDTVAWICGGQGSIVARIIYTLVALAGIWCISLLFREEDPAPERGH